MPEGRFTVAAAQISPRLGDIEANLALYQLAITEARGRGADLVVFPELSLTGYMLRDMVSTVALRLDAPELKHLKKQSQKIGILVGFVEETRSFRFHNCAMLLDRGEVAAVHRKVYLPTYGLFDEQRYFARGAEVRAFDTPLRPRRHPDLRGPLASVDGVPRRARRARCPSSARRRARCAASPRGTSRTTTPATGS